jgi:hypothetical protein
MNSTENGIESDLMQIPQKQSSSIRFNRDSLSNVIDLMPVGFLQSSAKHNFPRISTDRGIQIHCNAHFAKHDSSIRRNCESDTNTTERMLLGFPVAPANVDSARISTDGGITIDFNELSQKHSSPISLKRDSESNLNSSSFKHREKHCLPIFSTDPGIIRSPIKDSKKQNEWIVRRFDSDSNVIKSILVL